MTMNNDNNAVRTGQAAQHTPTPWNLHRYYDGAIFAVEREHGEPFTTGALVLARGDKIIGEVQFCAGTNLGWPRVSNPAEYRANAAFIVRACNSYAALVGALQLVAKHADFSQCPPEVEEAVDAALAQVKKEAQQ